MVTQSGLLDHNIGAPVVELLELSRIVLVSTKTRAYVASCGAFCLEMAYDRLVIYLTSRILCEITACGLFTSACSVVVT